MAVFCSSSSRFRFVVALGFTAGLLFAPAVLAADTTTTTTRSTEWGSLSNSFSWFYSDSNPSAVDAAASPEYLSTDRGDKDSVTSTSTKKDYYNSDDDQQGGSSSIHNDKQNKNKQEEEEEASLRLSRMITSCLAKSSVVEDIVHDLIEHTCQTKPWIAANLAEDLMSYDVLLERLKSLVTKIADQTSSVLSTATTATAPAAAAAVGGGEKEKKDHRVDDHDEDAAVLERLGLAIRADHEENDTVPDTTTTTRFDDDVLLLLPPPRTWSWFGGSIQIQVDSGRFQHAIARGKKGFFCSHHAWMDTIRRWLLHQMRDQVQRLDELKHDAIQFWSDKVQQCQECLYDDYSSDKTVIFLSSRVPGIVAVVLILVLYCWRVWHTLFVKRQNSNAQDDMIAVHFDDDQDSSTDPQDVTLVPDGEEPTDQGHTSANDTTISATVEANEPVPLASPQVTAVVAAAACSNDTERLATSTGTRNGEDEDEKPAGTTYVSSSPPGTPKEPPAGPLLLLAAAVSPEENSGFGMANAFSETPARSSRPLVVPDPQDGRSGEDDHDDDDKNYKTFLTPLRGGLKRWLHSRKENREAVEPAPETTLPPAPSMEGSPTTRPSEASALASAESRCCDSPTPPPALTMATTPTTTVVATPPALVSKMLSDENKATPAVVRERSARNSTATTSTTSTTKQAGIFSFWHRQASTTPVALGRDEKDATPTTPAAADDDAPGASGRPAIARTKRLEKKLASLTPAPTIDTFQENKQAAVAPAAAADDDEPGATGRTSTRETIQQKEKKLAAVTPIGKTAVDATPTASAAADSDEPGAVARTPTTDSVQQKVTTSGHNVASTWSNIRAKATSAAGTLFAGNNKKKGYDDDKSDQQPSRKRTLVACGDSGNNNEDDDDNNKSDQPSRKQTLSSIVMPNETDDSERHVNKKQKLVPTTEEEQQAGSRPPVFDLKTNNVQQASSGDCCNGDRSTNKVVTKVPKPNSTSFAPSQDSSKPSPGSSSTGATDDTSTGTETSSNGKDIMEVDLPDKNKAHEKDSMEVDLPDNSNDTKDSVSVPGIESYHMIPGQKFFLCEKCNYCKPVPLEYECYNKLVTKPGPKGLLIVDDSISQDFRKSYFKAFEKMQKHIEGHYMKDFCLSRPAATKFLPRIFQKPESKPLNHCPSGTGEHHSRENHSRVSVSQT